MSFPGFQRFPQQRVDERHARGTDPRVPELVGVPRFGIGPLAVESSQPFYGIPTTGFASSGAGGTDGGGANIDRYHLVKVEYPIRLTQALITTAAQNTSGSTANFRQAFYAVNLDSLQPCGGPLCDIEIGVPNGGSAALYQVDAPSGSVLPAGWYWAVWNQSQAVNTNTFGSAASFMFFRSGVGTGLTMQANRTYAPFPMAAPPWTSTYSHRLLMLYRWEAL